MTELGIPAPRPPGAAPTRFAARLSVRDLQGLLAMGRAVRFEAGERLMSQGVLADCVVLLRSGQVKVSVADRQGREHLLTVQGPGDLVGEVACVDGTPRGASVTALTPVRGVRIPCGAFLAYLERHPLVAIELLRLTASRLRTADRHRLDLGGREVHPRLVRTIREVARAFQRDIAAPSVEIPLNQEELAQLVNAAPVSVQRSLRGLRRRGIVTTGYRKVRVPCLFCLDAEVDALASGRSTEVLRGCGGAGHHRR